MWCLCRWLKHFKGTIECQTVVFVGWLQHSGVHYGLVAVASGST